MVSFFFLVLIFAVPNVAWSQYVPGQVIVKFVQGTKNSTAVDQASQSHPLDLNLLTPTIDYLQSEVDIPLQVTQITSGKRILLSIEINALIDQIADRLNMYQHIASVEVLSHALHPHGLSPSSKVIEVAFLPLNSVDSDSDVQQPENQSDLHLSKMVSELEKDIGIPLITEALPTHKVRLHVELKKLTLLLIERLQVLINVESAQPNYIATFQ